MGLDALPLIPMPQNGNRRNKDHRNRIVPAQVKKRPHRFTDKGGEPTKEVARPDGSRCPV